MPLLFSLAIHNALAEVKAQLNEGEYLFAFLDDIYVLAKPGRVRDIYNLLDERLFTRAGIQLHTGKTRTWNRAGVPPPRMEELGPDVWSGSGIKILGTPVGDDEFVRRLSEERISKEQHLWRAIAWVPDLQCAWQILLQCAGPRCHHYLRTLPPSQSEWYARHHDEGMMLAMEQLLGGLPGDEVQQAEAKVIATMPMRLGGLGLRSADRMAHAAYWASWADALHMIAGRLPEVANRVVDELNEGEDLEGCLAEVSAPADRLDRQGFVRRPGWAGLKEGVRSPHPSFSGAWRVATWLATSRVFCFRVPLSGDRDDCSVVCCRPGSFAVTLWTRQRRSVPRLSHPGGVPAAAWHLPNSVAGEVTSPTAHHRSSVRVRRKARPSGTPQGSLCPIGPVEEQSDAH